MHGRPGRRRDGVLVSIFILPVEFEIAVLDTEGLLLAMRVKKRRTATRGANRLNHGTGPTCLCARQFEGHDITQYKQDFALLGAQ